MKFRWNTRVSEQVAIQCIIIRITNRRMSLEEAIQKTLPIHSQNPEAIPQHVVNGLRRKVESELKAKRRNERASSTVGQH